MQCDIIIPVHNMKEATKDCLDSIYERTHIPFNLILIDNGSSDDTKSFLERFSSSHENGRLARNNDNIGWVKAINQGINLSQAPYVCLMNNDTVVSTDNWLSGLIDVARAEEEIGLVNPRFDIKKEAFISSPFIEIDFCRGYCILIKRAVIDKVGGLDEAYGMGYYDDDDFSVRAIHAGFKCVRANGVFVEHLRDWTFSSVFTGSERRVLHEKNKRLFYSKWGRRLNILFMIARRQDPSALSRLFFKLARRQHIVCVWSSVILPRFDHINIRIRMLPKLFSPLFNVMLFFNARKGRSRRYDLVFRLEADTVDEDGILTKTDTASKT